MSARKKIVVVGAGIAGLCAAISAAEAGAEVEIVDRAPKDERGGNSQWTEAYLRMKSDQEVSDDFEESLITNGSANPDPTVVASYATGYDSWPSYVRAHASADPDVVSFFANEVPPTLGWLKAMGLRFESLPIYHLAMSAPRIAAVGGGAAMVACLNDRLHEASLSVTYETTVVGLEFDGDGAISGVVLVDPDRRSALVPCDAVILASGGFEGNSEMLSRYMGPGARYLRPVAPGGYFNRGECIQMALDAGAAAAGDYTLYHAEPLDPRSRQAEAVVFVYNHGILVNKDARRFTDEAPGYSDVHYEGICHRISEQRDGIAYAIFDHTIEDVPNWRKIVRSELPPVMGQTIEELAEKLGLEPEALVDTVVQFNAACGSGHFDPLVLDGRSTKSLFPRKTHWARPLATSPYFAYPVVPGIVFTFGGLKTDSNARVMDSSGRPMPGLFAAGETVGLFFKNYSGATSVLRSAVFGRTAGRVAAEGPSNHQ